MSILRAALGDSGTVSILSALQTALGDFETWPSLVLRHLFIDEPTDNVVVALTAFFYGNGAPVALCSQALHACNPATTARHTDHIYTLYAYWREGSTWRRISVYYNISSNRYLYLNGNLLDQHEVARAPRRGRVFGIAGTGHADEINAMIQHIRDVGVQYYP